MIFKSIKMTNFRQFRGEVEIDFSHDKPITVIIAKNGVGKTTLLQAFRYCFYGDSPNYLKLPASDELLNSSLREELKEYDSVPFSVIVHFSHGDEQYFARREKVYQKRRGRIIEKYDESFMLNKFYPGEGYKPMQQDESELLMRQLMPPGLAHIYMFDGERMEKRVETSEYKKDLKEAITGILGIKKLETALSLMGTENMKTRVLGMVYENLKINSIEDQKAIEEKNRLSDRKEELQNNLNILEEDKTKTLKEIESWRDYQKEIDSNKDYVKEVKELELQNKNDILKRDSLAKEGISIASKLLKLKALAKTYKDYQSFVNNHHHENEFFQSLHIDTLKDIITKQRCICGEVVNFNSEKYNRIMSLEKHVLPFDNAHYLNKINEEFQQILEMDELYKKLEEKKAEIVSLKESIRTRNLRINSHEDKIRDFERQFDGKSPQDEIDRLREHLNNLTRRSALTESDIEANNKKLKEIEGKIKNIISNENVNIKIEETINSLNKVKSNIQEELLSNVESARLRLEENLNLTLSRAFEGDYHAQLDENFELNIKQRISDAEARERTRFIDQTRILSTGQSVMVSLSFIDALLQTLDDIRQNKNIQHGVIMDAALSNVDEKHIANVCKNILNNFDQLIFLSFKRQLRDEFYKGIGNNIGLSYLLEKDHSGNVIVQKITNSELSKYIHSVEEVE